MTDLTLEQLAHLRRLLAAAPDPLPLIRISADPYANADGSYRNVSRTLEETYRAEALVIAGLKFLPSLIGAAHTEAEACPCRHTTPCDPLCSCVMPYSSTGCRRCCSYGSTEQQKAHAEWLVQQVEESRDV